MEIHPNTIQAYKLLHDGTLALTRAEQQGMRIDLNYCEAKKKELTNRISKMETDFMESNFYKHWKHSTNNNKPNINSNAQLANFLYKIKKIEPATFTESGQGSTDEDALEQLNIPELNELLAVRRLKKLRDTYLDAFMREQVHGFLHPFFNLHLARTYRSSSDRPNFQNIPKRDKESMEICRRAIYPRLGHQLLEADFKSIEVAIAACYHKDPTMIKYLTDPTTDMHGDMAAQLFMIDNFSKDIKEHKLLRNAAKNGFVFPQFYGDYYKNCANGLVIQWGKLSSGKWKNGQGVSMPNGSFLSDHLISNGIKSYDQFTEHVKRIEHDFWANRFPHYARWKEKWWHEYQRKGYVDMFTGFRCSGVMSKNDTSNYPVQGAAFHCLLWCFIRLDEIMQEEQWDTKLIGQIHDAIDVDVNPAELSHVIKTIKHVTCKELPKAFPWINIPLNIEIELAGVDCCWAEIESYPKQSK